MKGPLTTQTLVGAIGTEPFHWRGDRENLAAFNGAFQSLMAADQGLSDEEMAQFQTFLASIVTSPNPFRNLDNSLQDRIMVRGRSASPTRGLDLYEHRLSDSFVFACVTCHSLPTGANAMVIGGTALLTPQDFKVSQLRNIYRKTGFDRDSINNSRGFGLLHDGSFENVDRFLLHDVFNLPDQQDRLDLEAFVWSMATDTQAGVGAQVTLRGEADDAAKTLILKMRSIADRGLVGLVVKGHQQGVARGYTYQNGSGLFQSDRAGQSVPFDNMIQSAVLGDELTFTLVPLGSQTRIGIDRDNDGIFDGDDPDPAPVDAKFIKPDLFKLIPPAPHYTPGEPH